MVPSSLTASSAAGKKSASMTDQPELWEALLPVIDWLEGLEISYYVGGSVASSLTGVARATQDADLVADLALSHAAPLVQQLESHYYLSEERIFKAIKERKSFNIIHFATAFKIDIFVLQQSSFARQTMSRRLSLEVAEIHRSLAVCSAEDIVLNKLQWYEMGHKVSDRQWYDLQGVLRLRGDRLDLPYLWHWAENLDLKDLLGQALTEAGLGDSSEK